MCDNLIYIDCYILIYLFMLILFYRKYQTLELTAKVQNDKKFKLFIIINPISRINGWTNYNGANTPIIKTNECNIKRKHFIYLGNEYIFARRLKWLLVNQLKEESLTKS